MRGHRNSSSEDGSSDGGVSNGGHQLNDPRPQHDHTIDGILAGKNRIKTHHADVSAVVIRLFQTMDSSAFLNRVKRPPE